MATRAGKPRHRGSGATSPPAPDDDVSRRDAALYAVGEAAAAGIDAVPLAEVIAVAERQWPRLVAQRSGEPGIDTDLEALSRRLARAYGMSESIARGEVDALRARLLLAYRARQAAAFD